MYFVVLFIHHNNIPVHHSSHLNIPRIFSSFSQAVKTSCFKLHLVEFLMHAPSEDEET